MPAKSKNVQHLKGLMKIAREPNKDKIRHVIFLYEKGNIKNYKTAENAVAASAFPSASTPKKVSELYQKAIGVKTPARAIAKLKLNYTLKMLLFTDVGKGSKDNEKNELTEEERKKYKKFLTKKYPNHRLFWAGHLDVSMGSDNFFAEVQDKLILRKDKKQWGEGACMTSA